MGQADEDLLRRWQRGDRAAFEALVRRWQGPIGRFVARLTGCLERTQDLCQETFLRVYLAGPRYRESGTFSPWLYRIALNVVRDAARRARPLRPLSATDEPLGEFSASTQAENQELTEIVQQALDELPAPLREVVVLRHYENLNFEQMARVLGTPASTLKSRFAVALERLRIRLKHLGWSPEETAS